EIVGSRLQGSGDTEALNLLGDVRADHMGTEKFTAVGVEDRFHEAVGFTDSECLSGCLQIELPDLQATPGRPRLLFGETEAGDLRPRVRTARNVVPVQRPDVLHTCKLVHAQHGLVAGLVGEARCACHVADRVYPECAGATPLI